MREQNTNKVSRWGSWLPTVSGVGGAALVVALLTLLSRISGLIRVRIFASEFGAGEVLDMYYAGFRIPDFLMGVLIVGTLSIAALPVISQALKKSEAEANKLVSVLLNYTFLGMLVVCAVVALAAPWFVRLVVPGFTDVQLVQVVLLTRVILVAQIFLALANVMSATLNSVKRFFWAGFSPVLYNAGLIVGAVWLYPRFGIVGLGYGVLLGAVVHSTAQLIDFYRAGFSVNPSAWTFGTLRGVGKLYLPRLFTLDLSQVILIVASVVGSHLAAGSISVFTLGFDIQAMPVGVFAFAVATASFPYFAEHYSSADASAFMRLLRESIVRILFYMTPVAIALLLLRAQAVRILYGAGQFGWDDTRATFEVLGVLAFSLVGQSLVPLFSRALLARHKTWTPVLVNLLSMGITIVAGYVLSGAHGINGVAAAYVIGVSVNAAVLYVLVRNSLLETAGVEVAVHAEEGNTLQLMGKVIVASAGFAIALYGGLYAAALIVNTHTWLGLVLQTVIASVCGGLVYLVIGATTGLPDARALVGKVFKRA